MITSVLDTSDEPEHVAWLNGLHDPSTGLIVVHVPPRCDARTLASEILRSLGRSPAKDYDQARGWVASWLATARPRADVLLYGTHRLTPQAARWCEELGQLAAVNLWLITNRAMPTEGPAPKAQATWPWGLFRSNPCHERAQAASIALELGGLPAPADWNPDGLPSFPFSHASARLLGPQSWQALMRLQLAYRGARERDIRPVLRAGSGPVHRNLAGAVARLALISTCRADISVLCRFLEHDVFLHDGLLRVDIDHVMSVLGGDNPFHQRSLLRGRGITDGAAHSDPLQAGRAVLDLPLGTWHRQHTGEVDVAIDGTHYIRTDGLRVDVPPWARWPLRALVWQRHHLPGQPSSATTDAVRTRSTTPSLYSEVRSTVAHVAGRIRNGMEPLTTLLVPAITYAPQDEGAAPTPGLIPQDAARAIWTVRRARPERRNPIPGFDDPGVQWLADHQLLLSTPSATPVLQPWLEAAVSKRLVVDGPRFDSDYHASWEKEAQRPNPYRPHRGPGTEAPPRTPEDNQFVRVAPAGAVAKRPQRTPTVSADVRRTLT